MVDVGSDFSVDFAAINTVDGELASEWSSQGDDRHRRFPLRSVSAKGVEIDAVAFRPREMSDGTGITRTFTVTP